MEEKNDFELTSEMKNILNERLKEDESSYLTAEESINTLTEKYSV